MRAHIEEPVSVPSIAEALGVHQRALERAFKAADMGTRWGVTSTCGWVARRNC